MSQQQMWGQHRNGRSSKAKTTEMPKNDHPTTFEQSIPPYAYPAQDNVRAREQREQQQASARQGPAMRADQHFSPDGDAMEHGYRPFNRYNNSGYHAPTWARPPRRFGSKPVRLLVLILLGVALLHAAPAIIAVMFAFVGVLALAIILPFVIIFAAVIAFAVLVLIVLKSLGVPLGRTRMFYRKRWGW